MHKLLLRQLKRHVGSADAIPKEWQPFADAVDDAYCQAEDDRALLERSLDLSSQELLERNRQLEKAKEASEAAEEALREKTQFLELTQIITTAADEATKVEDIMQTALDQVCAHTGWPVGHAYILADDGTGELIPTRIWHLDDAQQFEVFRRVTEETRFAPGVGLPGCVLASGKPEWMADVTKDPNFPRAKLATEIGVRGGFAFPVLVGRDVLAVLEFFSDKAAEPYEPLLEVMAQIGTQLGRVIERKRAEEALRESEARMRMILENSPVGVAIVSPASRKRLYCNPRLVEMIGADSADQLMGLNIADSYVDPTDLDRIRATIKEQGFLSDTEVQRKRLDGTTWWCLLSVNPVKYEGDVANINWFRDITKRKQAENALREQTKIVELLHETASEANQARDVEEALQGCIDSVCAYTGWPIGHAYVPSTEERDKLVPTKIWHLNGSKRFAAFRKMTEKTTFESGAGLPGRVLDSGKPAWIVDVTKDKNFRRAKLAKEIGVRAGFAFPVLVGEEVVAVLEFFAAEACEPDERLLESMEHVGTQLGRVVEREKAEARTAEKQAQLRVALDNMPGGMCMLDQDLKFQLFNDKHRDYYGLPVDALYQGAPLHDLVRFRAERGDFGPGDPEALVEQRIEDYRSGETIAFEERGPGGRVLEILRETTNDGGIVVVTNDITERKRAEEELQKSREQLQALADNLPEFVSLKDPERRFLFVNKRFEEWVCVNRKDVVGKTVHDIYPEEQATEYDALDRQAMDGRQTLSQESVISWPDGKTRTVIRTRFPVVSSQGEVLGLGIVNHDITDRKQAEQEVAQKEALLRIAMDNMPGGMFMLDQDLKYQLFNDKYRDYYGFPVDALYQGAPLHDVVRFRAERGDYGPGDPEALVEQRIEDYRRGETTTKEERRPGGRVLEILRETTSDGGIVVVTNDITERKRAEEELQKSREQLQGL
ncbi:MAG: PAS-domain containing protein, partial [Gemmatimonadetes bacterium]|nr:PAS-domain containing protein [Gemmatimonadota bacterium]